MKKIKILYVDDEKINLMLLKLNFRDKYEVITATSASEGLKLLESEKDISIVISDMRMPNITGIDFVKEAKNKYPEIKYFILTGLEVTSEINEALEAGLILDYFKKPFKSDEIENSIKANIINP